nr:site-specific integrase [uncultured Oscillibacter sp.]
MPLSEYTVEGVHACLCGILSDAVEGGFLNHNPAWRTYKYSSKKKEKLVADEETVQKIITALENESLKYETYFKLIIATGMRRDECCGLKWSDIDYERKSIHIQRNVVKITGEDIIVKDTKTAAGDRYVYFSPEVESLLKEYYRECVWQADAYEDRQLAADDFVFRKLDSQDPMTPSTFTWRFKLILKKNGLPKKLNVHSLRHSNASLFDRKWSGRGDGGGAPGPQPAFHDAGYLHPRLRQNKKAAREALQRGLDIGEGENCVRLHTSPASPLLNRNLLR